MLEPNQAVNLRDNKNLNREVGESAKSAQIVSCAEDPTSNQTTQPQSLNQNQPTILSPTNLDDAQKALETETEIEARPVLIGSGLLAPSTSPSQQLQIPFQQSYCASNQQLSDNQKIIQNLCPPQSNQHAHPAEREQEEEEEARNQFEFEGQALPEKHSCNLDRSKATQRTVSATEISTQTEDEIASQPFEDSDDFDLRSRISSYCCTSQDSEDHDSEHNEQPASLLLLNSNQHNIANTNNLFNSQKGKTRGSRNLNRGLYLGSQADLEQSLLGVGCSSSNPSSISQNRRFSQLRPSDALCLTSKLRKVSDDLHSGHKLGRRYSKNHQSYQQNELAEIEGKDSVGQGAGVGASSKESRKLGISFYILHTVLMAANNYAAQAVFKAAPTLSVMELTFVRGVLCSLFMLLWVNKDAKRVLIDSVERKSVGSLIFRCIQGGLSVMIAFMSIKYFSVSTVGIVCSLKPLIAMGLSWAILRERIGAQNIFEMVLVFTAVILVIIGGAAASSNQQSSDSQTYQTMQWALIALLMQPIMLAGGDIAMRNMRKMPEQLCSTYQNLTLMSLSGLYMACLAPNGFSLNYIGELNWEAWMLLCASCSLTIMTQVVKSKAFKHCEVNILQPLGQLTTVWQFAIDFLIIGVLFSTMQLAGFSILIGYYLLKLALSYILPVLVQKCKSDQEKERMANDDGYTVV